MSYRDADQLYDLLMIEATNGLGRGVVFALVSAARDFVAELLEKREKQEQEKELAKQILQETTVKVRPVHLMALCYTRVLRLTFWFVISSTVR